MRVRPPPSTQRAAPAAGGRDPRWLTMPNGSAVIDAETQQLKGYTTRSGKGRVLVFNAKEEPMGEHDWPAALNLLNTPAAVAAAREVSGGAPKRKRK